MAPTNSTTSTTSFTIDDLQSSKNPIGVSRLSIDGSNGFESQSKARVPIPSFGGLLEDLDTNSQSDVEDAKNTATNKNNSVLFLTQSVEGESDESVEDDGMGFDESDSDGSTTCSHDDVSIVDNKEALDARAKNLMQRREISQQRQQDYLLEIGLAAPSTSTQEQDGTDPTTTPQQEITPKMRQKLPQSPRGMLFKTPYNHHNSQSNGEEDEISLQQHLEQSYPYRQSQIRQLWSLLSPALQCNRQRATATSHLPPPIFVTGPEAAGKTTITRDLVAGLKRIRNNLDHEAAARVGCAYVNCATTSSIDGMLHDAYRQLAMDMKLGRQNHHETPRRKRKRAKSQNTKSPTVTEGFFARALKQAKKVKKQRVQVDDNDTANAANASGGGEASSLEALMTKEEEDEDQTPEAQPRRSSRVRKELTDSRVPCINQAATKVKAKGAVSKEASLDIKATASPSADLQGPEANAVSRTSQVTVATFGQEVKQSLFKHHDDCAFLILDQAERLLSLSSTSTSKPNFLAQLLLIPQTKGLNLTIIVISKSTVLEHFRFNNSFSTVSSAVLPLKVHFHAYKGKEAFRQIMSQPTLLKRIIGPSMLASYSDEKDPFVRLVVKSFLNVLVQSLYGSTRDLKEMIRLGGSLWPKYILPLHSTKLRETKESVRKMCPSVKSSGLSLQSHSKEIVSFLDVQILPEMRQCLEASIYSLCADSPASSSCVAGNNSHAELGSMSYLTKCLMLAAFICQTNRADKDKQLFTIQKNGKKNNGNKRKNPGEDLAYGAAKRGASKLNRPRMFPMERMLSVFVSIVGLNKDQQARGNRLINYEILPASTGSADFFESLSHLRDIRVLHDKETSSEAANLVAPKFWCSLTRDEADVVARSVSFPLEQFLM